MFANLRHVGIVTDNLEKSLEFYRDILGFKIKTEALENKDFIDRVLNLKNASLKTVKLVDQRGGIIELLHYDNPANKTIKREVNDLGLSHFALTVENLDDIYNMLKKSGANFISAPKFSPDKKAKVCFCYDPNGVAVELVEEII